MKLFTSYKLGPYELENRMDGDRSGSFTWRVDISPVVSLWTDFASIIAAGGRPACCSLSHQARR